MIRADPRPAVAASRDHTGSGQATALARGARHEVIGNRALTAILRQEAPTGAEGATAVAAEEQVGSDSGQHLAGDPGELAEGPGMPRVGDTISIAEDEHSGSKVSLHRSQAEAESWASKLWNPVAAGYTALGLPPSLVVNTSFFANHYDKTLPGEIEKREAAGDHAGAGKLRQQSTQTRRLAFRRSLRMAPEELIRNYLMMSLVDPNEQIIRGNETLDTLVKLGINTGTVILLGTVHNVVMRRIGFGPAAGPVLDSTASHSLTTLRIAFTPTIMWHGAALESLGVDPEVAGPLSVGTAVSTAVSAYEFSHAGREARRGPRVMAAAAGAEARGAGGLRLWLREARALLGAGADTLWNLRRDIVSGFKIQMADSAKFIGRLRRLGLGGALKAGPVPGIWKVGPIFLILPAAQAWIAGQLGEPPPPSETDDTLESVIALNLWRNMVDPAITAVAVGGLALGGPLAAALVYLEGLRDSERSSHAISLAIEHGRRLSKRVDHIRRSAHLGSYEGDGVAAGYATQLRTGLTENDDFDPSDDPVSGLIEAAAPNSGLDVEAAEAVLLDRLVDSLVMDYYRRHQDDLGTNDLRSYRTYLRIAVGRPADRSDQELVAAE